MTNLRLGTMMLVLGLILGSSAMMLLRQPSVAVAQQQSMGSMKMESRSAGDTEMNAAMSRMMQKISMRKPTGVQDQDFMIMMISHHQSAVKMANIELRKGEHSPLKALARNIIKSQDKEIVQMRGWLKMWYAQSAP